MDGVETADDTRGSADWLTVRTVPWRRRCKGNVHRHDLRKIIGSHRMVDHGGYIARFSERGKFLGFPSAKLTSQSMIR